jgi:hypothetical protein
MDVKTWLTAAQRDADGRHLPDLKPLLETLAASTIVLREADERARRRAEPSAPPPCDDD